MAGLVTANLLVGRMFGPAAGIARLDRQNARSPLHQMFDAPKAASCENGRIGRGALFAGRPLEIERNGVDAMADILGRESLAGEHMAQMSSAFRADDLGPASVGVGNAPDRSLDLVIETGPAAARIELVRRAVKRLAALPAAVDARLVVVVILAGEGPLGALVDDHPFFFLCKRFHALCR